MKEQTKQFKKDKTLMNSPKYRASLPISRPVSTPNNEKLNVECQINEEKPLSIEILDESFKRALLNPDVIKNLTTNLDSAKTLEDVDKIIKESTGFFKIIYPQASDEFIESLKHEYFKSLPVSLELQSEQRNVFSPIENQLQNSEDFLDSSSFSDGDKMRTEEEILALTDNFLKCNRPSFKAKGERLVGVYYLIDTVESLLKDKISSFQELAFKISNKIEREKQINRILCAVTSSTFFKSRSDPSRKCMSVVIGPIVICLYMANAAN